MLTLSMLGRSTFIKSVEKEDPKTTLFANMDSKIVGLDGEGEVRSGTVGELCMRSPNVAKGYWQNTKATENSFAKDRWPRTWDAATIDGSGNLSLPTRVQVRLAFLPYTITALKPRPLGPHQSRQ